MNRRMKLLEAQRNDAWDDILKLREALEEISDVLGTGGCHQENCEGCDWEHQHAGTVAREALWGKETTTA